MAFSTQSLSFNPINGEMPGFQANCRSLSQLSGCFSDQRAYQALLVEGDPFVYAVTNVELASGEGQLHYGLGVLQPGKVGWEYFMTRGHLHAWRPAAEVYICLKGQGMMVLEDETGGNAHVLPFSANNVVYVPGYTAHRTVNTGSEPLVYWGVLSSQAGHDYEAVQKRNFSQAVIELDGQPCALQRSEYERLLSEEAR